VTENYAESTLEKEFGYINWKFGNSTSTSSKMNKSEFL